MAPKKKCPHGKQKYYCRECGGKGICEHGVRKYSCKPCGGNGICKHKKEKPKCKDCNGSFICEHKIRKDQCKRCGGTQICSHGRQKPSCKECKGSRICEHGNQKQSCRICDIGVHPNNWCSYCKYTNVVKSLYRPYCFQCYCVLNPDAEIKYKYKLKEHHLRDELLKSYLDTELVFDKRVDGGCSLRRPDVMIDLLTHTLIIEMDENKHSGYSCENKRTMELFQDLGDRPLVLLRFNPDSYKEKGTKIPGCFKKTNTIDNSIQKKEWNRRMIELKKHINKYLKTIPTKEVTIIHLFYGDTQEQPRIQKKLK